MDNEKRFSSMSELYNYILPALNAKVSEFERKNIHCTSLDIWNYCVSRAWRIKNDLRIYELIDDIFNIDINSFLEYLKKAKDDKNAR